MFTKTLTAKKPNIARASAAKQRPVIRRTKM